METDRPAPLTRETLFSKGHSLKQKGIVVSVYRGICIDLYNIMLATASFLVKVAYIYSLK